MNSSDNNLESGDLAQPSTVVCRSMSKTQLMRHYCKGVKDKSCLRNYQRWYRRCPALQQALKDTGYYTRQKILTPRQVAIIMYHFGTP